MYIIEVIPIGRGVLPGTLSYFSLRAHERGALVGISVRSKELPAIVTTCTDAFSMKAALRAATFSLRRLKDEAPRGRLSPELIETAEYLARYYATNLGTILSTLLPKEVRDGSVPLPSRTSFDDTHIPAHRGKPIIFQDTEEHRFHEYERMIRESFAQKHSFVCVVPSLAYVSSVTKRLSQGIEAYTVILHGNQTPSMLKKAFQMVHDSAHPLFIIATPSYAIIERSDIGTVTIEHERSASYVGRNRPYLDMRIVLQEHSLRSGRRCILSDSVVRSEDMHALRVGDASSWKEELKRLELKSKLTVIEMKPDSDGQSAFTLLSPVLLDALRVALAKQKRVFLFSARRGLAPLVACIDCGHIVRDPDSRAPLALERRVKNNVEERWFVSSVSGYKVRAYDLCTQCGSWRLRERGIGIQQVYDELKKHIPDYPIILIDHLSAQTEKKAATLATEFYSHTSAILLGTGLALPRITDHVHVSAVISMDALRSLPSWRQQEEMFAVLMALREKTEETVYVQTRTEDDIFELVRRGHIGEFYTQELALRESFHYPPHTVFVHLSWNDTDRGATTALIEQQFAPYTISLYSSPHITEGAGTQYGLMRIPKGAWPHDEIVERIRALPPSIRVMINPDRIV